MAVKHLNLTGFLLSGALILMGTGLRAQDYVNRESGLKRHATLFEHALEFHQQRENEKALARLDIIIDEEPNYIDAHLLRAQIQYEQRQVEAASKSLECVMRLDSFYHVRSLYSLGRIYEELADYDKAIFWLNKYLQTDDLTERQRSRISRRVQALQIKQRLKSNPVPYVPRILPGTINTCDDESLPAFTVDGQQMIYTRRSRGQEDLYVSAWDEEANQWSQGFPILSLNSPHNEGAQSISADGKVVAFTSCGRPGGIGSCDIYMAYLQDNGEWSRARNLTEINTRGWEAQPSLSADGRTLYFSSSRRGGMGGRDLWVTTRDDDYQWSKPENLGPTINTAGNESSPFLHFDDRTLYFMSDGHPGMGDYDLFVTNRGFDGWAKPENLGYPINTIHREGALSVHPNGIDAYYTQTNTCDNRPQTDLLVFQLDSSMRATPVSYLKGVVRNAQTGEPVQAQVEIFNIDAPGQELTYNTGGDGKFTSALTHGETFGMHVRADGYAFFSEQFTLSPEAPYGSQTIEVQLVPVVSGVQREEIPIVLRNIQFETNSARLLSSSRQELNRLRQLLEAHPDLRIEIRGHTDNVGSPEFNQDLSESRAEAVYKWLISEGIDEDRLTYIGFGESQPVATNDTPEGRSLNRRTEFVIID